MSRAAVVDTLTALVFFTFVATLSELLIAGLTVDQVLASRLTMVPVMLLTGRPYGLWRNAAFARLRPTGAVHRAATDVFAFTTFQMPLYAIVLVVVGAAPGEIAAAVGSAAVGMVLLSRSYGMLLDAVRRLAGVGAAWSPS